MATVDEERNGTGRRQVWIGVLAAFVVVAALAVVSVISSPGSKQSSQANDPAVEMQKARQSAARRVPGDPLAMGSPTAPVAIVVWADFQCPYCGQFTKESEPTLVNRYVKTGKARLEWRDFAFLGKESTSAAIAARAAGRQGKFWPYHDLLFAEQHPENSGALTTSYLVGLARRLGLDTARFQADMADPALAKQAAADQAAGTALGVNGTPTVLVNGQLVSGAEPLSTYQQAVDAALAHPNPAR
jgi:protein-disulfide isomerase